MRSFDDDLHERIVELASSMVSLATFQPQQAALQKSIDRLGKDERDTLGFYQLARKTCRQILKVLEQQVEPDRKKLVGILEDLRLELLEESSLKPQTLSKELGLVDGLMDQLKYVIVKSDDQDDPVASTARMMRGLRA